MSQNIQSDVYVLKKKEKTKEHGIGKNIDAIHIALRFWFVDCGNYEHHHINAFLNWSIMHTPKNVPFHFNNLGRGNEDEKKRKIRWRRRREGTKYNVQPRDTTHRISIFIYGSFSVANNANDLSMAPTKFVCSIHHNNWQCYQCIELPLLNICLGKTW